jgi:hypothetical protein
LRALATFSGSPLAVTKVNAAQIKNHTATTKKMAKNQLVKKVIVSSTLALGIDWTDDGVTDGGTTSSAANVMMGSIISVNNMSSEIIFFIAVIIFLV